MAAPMVPGRKKDNKRLKQKNVLNNPYNISWPAVQNEVEEEVLQQIQSTLKSLDIARAKSRHRGRKNKTEETKDDKPSDEGKQSIRKQLLIGVNNVTRGLEKDDVRLVITCRSAQPAIITRHLIGLSASRQCPAVCIPKLSQTIGEVMNMSSVVALGIMKKPAGCTDGSVFDELVEFVAKRSPVVSLPWLPESSKIEDTTSTVKECAEVKTNELSSSHAGDESINEAPSGETVSVEKEDQMGPKEDAHEQINKVDSERTDFSKFYVFKSDRSVATKRKCPEFISFSGEMVYQKTDILRIPGNPLKKKKKNKNLIL